MWLESEGNYGNTGCGVFKGVTKLEIYLPKNQHTYSKEITKLSSHFGKSLNFENWVNGEVSKIGHHFSM